MLAMRWPLGRRDRTATALIPLTSAESSADTTDVGDPWHTALCASSAAPASPLSTRQLELASGKNRFGRVWFGRRAGCVCVSGGGGVSVTLYLLCSVSQWRQEGAPFCSPAGTLSWLPPAQQN